MLVASPIGWRLWSVGWFVRSGRIMHLRQRPQAPRNSRYSLSFYDFATRQSRTITQIDGPVYMGLAVSLDGRTFLFSRSAVFGSDLMLIDNFR